MAEGILFYFAITGSGGVVIATCGLALLLCHFTDLAIDRWNERAAIKNRHLERSLKIDRVLRIRAGRIERQGRLTVARSVASRLEEISR